MPAELKIVLYLLFVTGLFFIDNPVFYGCAGVIIGILFITKLVRFGSKGWIPVIILLVFTFFGNILFRHGRVLFTAGPLIVTEEGLTDASVKTLRILCMITGARLLTATTPVESLVRAFGWFLKPLQHAGIPVNDFVSTMGLTLQSLPALRDQMINNGREIMKRDNVSGFWNRVRVIAGLLMPLFVQSLQTPERIFRNTKK